MEHVHYRCPNYPGLEIGNLVGHRKIKFVRGVFVAKFQEQVDLIEANEWIGVYIHRVEMAPPPPAEPEPEPLTEVVAVEPEAPAPEPPSYDVSKSAKAELKKAGVTVEEAAAALGLAPGDAITVKMARSLKKE